jgi:hypothetical protein
MADHGCLPWPREADDRSCEDDGLRWFAGAPESSASLGLGRIGSVNVMSPQRGGRGPSAAESLRLSAPARICLGAVGTGLMSIGSTALLAFKLDGAGVTSFVISGALLAGLGAMGRLPNQLKLKDVELGWQLQQEEINAIALAAAKPEAEDASLLEKSAIPEPPKDLTLPLFEDPARLADLAAISPKAALLAIFGELDEQARGLALDAGLLSASPRIWPLGQVVNTLVAHGWLSGWHANVVRSLTNARNAVAHSPSDVPDIEVTALLGLAGEIASDFRIRRRAALSGYTPKSEAKSVTLS